MLQKSHDAPVPYSTMQHLATEMCTHAHFCYKMIHCGIFVLSRIVRFVIFEIMMAFADFIVV